MVYDHYEDKWRRYTQPPHQNFYPPITTDEIEEFRRLLERAREYDRAHGQPDCELVEKRKRVQQLADELGVQVDFL